MIAGAALRQLRTGRPALIPAPPGPGESPAPPLISTGDELCLEDEEPLAATQAQSPAGRTGRQLCRARSRGLTSLVRTRRASLWRARAQQLDEDDGLRSLTALRAEARGPAGAQVIVQLCPVATTGALLTAAGALGGWTGRCYMRLVPAGRACVGAGARPPGLSAPVSPARAGAALCSSCQAGGFFRRDPVAPELSGARAPPPRRPRVVGIVRWL